MHEFHAAAPQHFLSALDGVKPGVSKGHGLRVPRFTVDEIKLIYAYRDRGYSWSQINDALPQPLPKANHLASVVHTHAKWYGVEPVKRPIAAGMLPRIARNAA
jgi:hypothetical protein